MLRIVGVDQSGAMLYEDGKISLEYSIDDDFYNNEVFFKAINDGKAIEIVTNSYSEILSGSHNLKSLIVGFPQLRSEVIKSTPDVKNKITQPHVDDLLPIIFSNEEDNRLNAFISWIVNLDVKALQESSKNQDIVEIKENAIIKKVFEIISEITKHEIKFLSVKSASPPDVWVSTYDSPNGVPLSMVSQGFKIIMSWVGYYLERLIESFPALGTNEAITQNAILIIDEIDTSIHPKWQAEFIKIIRQNFKNTQFIFTTHSPLVAARLNREQITEFDIDENGDLVVKQNQIDTWSTSYDDILNKIFNTQELPPLYNIEQLEDELSKLGDGEDLKKSEIKENINRLIESNQYKDRLAKYENELKEKKVELDELIESLKLKKNR